MRVSIILIGLGLLLGVPTSGQALDPDVKCEAAKVKETAKYYACRLKAESKAIKKAEVPDFSKCDSKYSEKWQKAETKAAGACPTSGDEALVKTRVTRDADEVAASVTGFKRVFLSSRTYSADLGGLAGADAKCQELADAASLGGIYKAWLSDGTNSPSITFVQATVPYILVDGTLIANDWADLTDGELANLINKTEWGGVPPLQIFVFTNTTGGGAVASSVHCNNWTNDVSGDGTVGAWSFTLAPWSFLSSTWDCEDFFLPVYCFEQ